MFQKHNKTMHILMYDKVALSFMPYTHSYIEIQLIDFNKENIGKNNLKSAF